MVLELYFFRSTAALPLGGSTSTLGGWQFSSSWAMLFMWMTFAASILLDLQLLLLFFILG
jgi:hypothetical protein